MTDIFTFKKNTTFATFTYLALKIQGQCVLNKEMDVSIIKLIKVPTREIKKGRFETASVFPIYCQLSDQPPRGPSKN